MNGKGHIRKSMVSNFVQIKHTDHQKESVGAQGNNNRLQYYLSTGSWWKLLAKDKRREERESGSVEMRVGMLNVGKVGTSRSPGRRKARGIGDGFKLLMRKVHTDGPHL